MSKICANCHQELKDCQCEHTTAIGSEQELLIPRTPEAEAKHQELLKSCQDSLFLMGAIKCLVDAWLVSDGDDTEKVSLGIANVVEPIIIAKLKAMGYEPPDKCLECDGDGRQDRHFDRCFSNRCPNCNGYGWIKRLKWDREKVAKRLTTFIYGDVAEWDDLTPDGKELMLSKADQLKEILTGGK